MSNCRPRRQGLQTALAVAVVLASMISAPALDAQTTRPGFPVTDGPVRVLTVSGNVLYVAGDFEMIGRPSGAAVPVDTTSGAPAMGFPVVRGVVYAAIEDGSGGWYLAGSFDRVGGQARRNLVRIRGDYSVHPWNPGANGPVYALAVIDGLVYAGGAFTTIGGEIRSRFAALSVVTGMPATGTAAANDVVRTIIVQGWTIYLGGAFTTLGGQARNRIAAIDRATGVVHAWNPNVSGTVLCLAAADGILYAGGEFMKVGSVTRHRLAAFELPTGVLTPWNGTANQTVRALAVSGGKVYVGGDFWLIGGQTRSRVAALSTRWWQALEWNPGSNLPVTAIVVRGNRVYVGGEFTMMGGQPRHRAALLDTTTSQVAAWDPKANGTVHAIVPSGPNIYLGGAFSGVGGHLRSGVAAIDRSTDDVIAWDPQVEYRVRAIAAAGGVVYLGGWLGHVGGAVRGGLAAVDSVTAQPKAWNPQFGREVYAIAVSGSRVYVGSGRQAHLTTVDAVTGNVIWWQNVNSPHGQITSLHVAGNRLYAGGWYDSIGTVRCGSGFVALNSETGELIRTYPTLLRQQEGLTVTGGNLFMGGYKLASVDVASSDLRAWPQTQLAFVGPLASQGARVYAGGGFTTVGGQARLHLAAFDALSGSLTDWNPGANGDVFAMVADGGTVYVGGPFTTVAGAPHSFLAAIDDPDVLDVPNQRSAGPWAFELLPVHPNPLSSSSIARVRLDRPARVTLDLVDVTGRRMRTVLSSRELPAGEHRWALDRGSLAAGIYWLRLVVDGDRAAQRIVVLR